MGHYNEQFEKDILEASINIRNETKSEDEVHITSKADLDTYMMTVKSSRHQSLWCPEFNEAVGEVLEGGAEKYAPRDWEKPDGYSMGYKSQCDAIFHHLAREFVYKENQTLIDTITDILSKAEPGFDSYEVLGLVEDLLTALKYDEMGTRHLQHVATRSLMSFTREKRGLD